MSATDVFRDQHKELLSIAGEITSRLSMGALQVDAREVRSLLSKLAGKLSVHLSMEDKSLYPTLLAHKDDKVQQTARRFMQEMGGLSGAFNSYKGKWQTPATIQENPSVFIAETKDVFRALSQRIQRENAELYVLLERIER